MLYFQLSEPEYYRLRSVQEQLGLISGLISGTHPEYSLEVVSAMQLLAFIKDQEEVLGGLGMLWWGGGWLGVAQGSDMG